MGPRRLIHELLWPLRNLLGIRREWATKTYEPFDYIDLIRRDSPARHWPLEKDPKDAA